MKQLFKKTIVRALAAALVVTALAGFGALKRVDKWAQDVLYQRPGVTSSNIVIIGIDEDTLEEFGPYNSWDRSLMAAALEVLAADPEHQPAVTAVDVLYAGESDAAADERLVSAASALNHIVVASMAEFGTRIIWEGARATAIDTYAVIDYKEPFAALRDVAAVGSVNAMYDQDGIMRHAVLYVEPAEGERVYSMAFETARLYMEGRGEEIGSPAVNALDQFYIPFTGKPGDFYEGVSFADLIDGRVPADYYAGKIVLIGPYAAAMQDAYFTSADRSRPMYGVELQANVIQSFLEGNFKRELSDLPQLIALFCICTAAAYLFLKKNVGLSGLICAVVMLCGVAASLLLYRMGLVAHLLWLPVGVAILYVVSVAVHYIRAAIEKQRITHTFERYVAPEIVQEILREGMENLALGGKVYDIAVLFVDVRGFTTMSERLDPEKVVFILNRYLSMASSCIEKNKGTLDKFIGDATMAFWGAPLTQDDPVYLAARAAFDIIRGSEQVSEQLKSEIGEELRVGVGIHYGPAVVGNMGSERHLDYTAIGDTVNTASRLEANAPGGTVYVSRAVADALGDRAQCTSLGDAVRLKGKTEGFEVLTLDALR